MAAKKTKTINPKGLTANDIRAAMAKRWSAPEWAIMWEVANATGTNARRSADAVMMSLWPSRGLELHGVEIKISRADWKREAKDPTKAEEIARYCDRWWVHTPVGVVDDVSDMPPAWGLREWSGSRWVTIREAEKTKAEPVGRSFLASLLRRSEEASHMLAHEANKDLREKLAEEFRAKREQLETRIQHEVDRRTREHAAIVDKVAEFEKATGAKIERYGGDDMAQIGACAVALSKTTQPPYAGGLDLQAERLEAAAATLRELHAMKTD